MKRASAIALGPMLLVSVLGCSGEKDGAPPSGTDTSDTSGETNGSATDDSSGASTTNTPPPGNPPPGNPPPGNPPPGNPPPGNPPPGNPPPGNPPPAQTSGEDTSAPITSGETITSSSDATDPTSSAPDTPSGPPDGAYVPCSGTDLPAIGLEQVILPPKVDKAIHLLNPPGQPNMFYVVEREGAFKRFDMSQENPTAVTLTTLSGVSTSGEYGFLSAALHPNFDGVNEKRAYLVYTPSQSFIIKEYEIDGDTATEVGTFFEFTGDTASNHNGGLAVFGPDGYLYVGIGDGGGGNDQHGSNGNGQNVNTTYGKILRFDIDAPDTPVPGNLTTDDVDGEMVDGRILHYGLRNPWRFTFDRLNGDLYIGDVGQDTREEVDMLPASAGPTNFGWAAREGFGECPGCSASVVGLTATDPIYDYENPPGNGASARSVTGGYVYRGTQIPGLYGRYVFADYQTGQFTVLTADGAGPACDVIEDAIDQNELREQGIASFAEDVDGELYVISLNDGIFKFVPAQ